MEDTLRLHTTATYMQPGRGKDQRNDGSKW